MKATPKLQLAILLVAGTAVLLAVHLASAAGAAPTRARPVFRAIGFSRAPQTALCVSSACSGNEGPALEVDVPATAVPIEVTVQLCFTLRVSEGDAARIGVALATDLKPNGYVLRTAGATSTTLVWKGTLAARRVPYAVPLSIDLTPLDRNGNGRASVTVTPETAIVEGWTHPSRPST